MSAFVILTSTVFAGSIARQVAMRASIASHVAVISGRANCIELSWFHWSIENMPEVCGWW